MEEVEILLASSPTDAGISCWNLRSGEELLLHKLCSSPPHGIATVAGRFLASSQLRDSRRSSSGSTFHWSWNKPQVKVSSSLAEPIGPLVSHSEGTHIVGGGLSGDIYFWEVRSLYEGKLLRSIVFSSIIDAIVLGPTETDLYAGGRDGKIHIAGLSSPGSPNSSLDGTF